MFKRNQFGFSIVEAAIAVVVVGAIGVTGYLAYDRIKDTDKSPTATQQTDEADVPTAPAVEESGDLDAALKTLDDTDIDASASDSAALDTEASSF
jgi:hypothetical protein